MASGIHCDPVVCGARMFTIVYHEVVHMITYLVVCCHQQKSKQGRRTSDTNQVYLSPLRVGDLRYGMMPASTVAMTMLKRVDRPPSDAAHC